MTVKRDSGRVWIDGVRVAATCERGSSVHGAVASICEAMGEPLSYDQLICFGGLAFRVQVHETFCPSAAHPCCGFMCVENSNRALPWKIQFIESFPWSNPKPDRAAFERDACAAIRKSIDQGVPVHYGSEEDGVIIGYADEARRWRCLHPYHQGGREAFWYDEASGFAGEKGKWPWGITVYTERAADRVPTQELMIATLRQAVQMWRAERRKSYLVGDSAYAHWIKWLESIDAGECSDPIAGMQGNGWCFDTLIQYRRSAMNWLEQIAKQFEPPARDELQLAASHYASLVDACTKGLGSPWDLAVGPKRHDEWTRAMRRDQIARLQIARDQDCHAIAALDAVTIRAMK